MVDLAEIEERNLLNRLGTAEVIDYVSTPVRKYAHEMIEVFDIKGNFQGVWSRKAYYAKLLRECRKNIDYASPFQVKSVRLQLFHPDGRLYLQKRSYEKVINSGLIDKTLGGHVKAGKDFQSALKEECAQELGLTDIVVLAHDEFLSENILKYDLDKTVVCTEVNVETGWWCKRIALNNPGGHRFKFSQPWMNSFYIGFYSGNISLHPDGECQEVFLTDSDEIFQKIDSDPNSEIYCPELSDFLSVFRVNYYKGLLKNG